MGVRGISNIIVVVLTILVAMAGIALIWNVILLFQESASQDIEASLISSSFSLPAQSAYVTSQGDVSVVVKREAGKGNVVGVQVVIEDSSGKSYSTKKNAPIQELGTERIEVPKSEHNLPGMPVKVSIAPIILTQSGNEVTSNSYISVDLPAPEPTNTAYSYPVISNAKIANISLSGYNLTLATDEDANCRYSEGTDNAFDQMNTFLVTGNKIHTQIGTINGSGIYRFYVRCRDTEGNINNVAEVLILTIGSPIVPLQKTCIDDDESSFNQSLFIKSNATEIVNGSRTSFKEDVCRDNSTLLELYCDATNSSQYSEITCPNGCLEGECIESPEPPATCGDSDGGLNYSIMGAARSSANGNYTDYCYNAPTWNLKEYYCNNDGYVSDSNYLCPNGCLNGACLSSNNTWCNGADINHDGEVNDIDKHILAQNYRRRNCYLSNNWCNGSDINRDGSANILDLALFARAMGDYSPGCAVPPIPGNQKNMVLYSPNEVFMMSDKDWKDVLPWVSVTTWTGNESGCTRGYGTPANVCVYPTLVYHGEETLAPEPLPEMPANPGELGYTPAYSVNDKSLVRIYLNPASEKEFLNDNFDVAEIGKGYVDVVVTKKQRDAFSEEGYDFETLPVNAHNPFKDPEEPGIAGYHTYDSMTSELYNLSLQYPIIMKVEEIGSSIQGRKILAVKISDNANIQENETRALVAGNHHAREIMTVEVPIYMINYLVKSYDINPEIKNIVDNYEIWFIPMANPDGHVKVEGGDMWWRKNLRDNNENGEVDSGDGVDLNRNYGFTWGWDNRGSSDEPYSDTYRGVAAFSEPETQAVRNLSIQNNFSYVLDYHSAGGYILYPWGHIISPAPDNEIFENISQNWLSILPEYNAGQISDVMYYSNGDSIDWHYGEQTEKSKSISFGFELSSSAGFNPPASEIVPKGKEQLNVLLVLLGYPLKFSSTETIDSDSAVYFMQQYPPERLTLVGNTPLELDNLLSASPPVGAGIDNANIIRVNSSTYINYWKNYTEVVYSEGTYEIALIASTYASLINAPLIIQGNSNDYLGRIAGKKIICVGNAAPRNISCNENYNLKELQEKYLASTGSKKIMLVNPDDLSISSRDEVLYPERTSTGIRDLYSKNSLVASFLASAKHEILVSTHETTDNEVDREIEQFFWEHYNESIYECTYTDNCSKGFSNQPVEMLGAENAFSFKISGMADISPRDLNSEGKILVNTPEKFTFSVENNGFDVARGVHADVYYLNDSSIPSGGGGGGGGGKGYSDQVWVHITQVDLGDIEEDEYAEGEFTWIPENGGNALIFINASSLSNESNIDNNGDFWNFDVNSPMADIDVRYTGKDKIAVYSQNNLSFVLSNLGNLVSNDITLRLYEEKYIEGIRTDLLVDEKSLSGMNASEQRNVSFEFTPNEMRTYDFKISADVNQDGDLLNNVQWFSVTSALAEPYISFWAEIKDNYVINESAQIHIWMYNNGLANAENTVVSAYWGRNEESTELIDEVNIGNVSESAELNINWTPREEGRGALRINVSYDSSKGMQSIENTYWIRISQAGPDVRGWMNVNSVELNERTQGSISIQNIGNKEAENISVMLKDNDAEIWAVSQLTLDAGEFRNLEFTWNPQTVGRHELGLNIDAPGDVYPEDNTFITDRYAYVMKNSTFSFNDGTSPVKRFVAFGYSGDTPQVGNEIDGSKVLRIPDIQSDIYISNAENLVRGWENESEYETSVFRNSDIHSNMITISKNYNTPRLEGNLRLYRIYANEVLWNYDSSEAYVSYPDYTLLGTPPDNLTLYHCANWDFDYELCLSGWVQFLNTDKNFAGTQLVMHGHLWGESAEAFAVGEDITGKDIPSYSSEGRSIDYSKLIKQYELRNKFDETSTSPEARYYQILLNGFFFNCTDDPVRVNVTLNGLSGGEAEIKCYSNLPSIAIKENLGGYYINKLRNVTITFPGDVAFYNESEIASIRKGKSEYPISKQDSQGLKQVNVNSFGASGESSFAMPNKNYTHIVVNIEIKGTPPDIEVFANGQKIGEIDVSNSNGKKGREFTLPSLATNSPIVNITVKPKSPGIYLAGVRFKTNFDPYYLTIVSSSNAIPFRQGGSLRAYESDFREYGSLDSDAEAELAVGRIMGITNTDNSAYIARDLFYPKLNNKQRGATLAISGDRLNQGIPMNTCGKGFCECYYDVSCEELFNRHTSEFNPYITCSNDLIGGIPQENGPCYENLSTIREGITNKSVFSAYGGHGSPEGWADIYSTGNMKEMTPQFSYGFACSTCDDRDVKVNLFCSNMIRRGAMGYTGSVEVMYGNHYLDEVMDAFVANQSIGHAFKIGKNKEANRDWRTKLISSDSEMLNDMYGMNDLLLGDPTFVGGGI